MNDMMGALDNVSAESDRIIKEVVNTLVSVGLSMIEDVKSGSFETMEAGNITASVAVLDLDSEEDLEVSFVSD